MQSRQTIYPLVLVILFFTAGLPFFTGCNQTTATKVEEAKPRKLPKLKFHKPKTFQTAVSRLDELRNIVISEDPLPSPKTFKVVETIHGSGPGGHSHYNLAKDFDSPNQDPKKLHGHDVEDSSQKIHNVQVDAITEMLDIIKWMPNIAGDTDMDKTTWETVKTDSDRLQTALDEKLSETSDADQKRETIRNLDAQIVLYTKSLSTISAQMTESAEPDKTTPED